MKTLDVLKLTLEEKRKGKFIKGNKYNGEYKEWWYHNILSKHYFINNGRFDKDYKSWNIDGILITHRLYKQGKLIDIYK